MAIYIEEEMMICVVVLPSCEFVVFESFGFIKMSGRYTGEENELSTLVLPSVFGLGIVFVFNYS